MFSAAVPVHGVLTAVTNLGESVVLGTLAAAGALYLLLIRRPREGLLLGGAFLSASLAIAILKILFISCGRHLLNIYSPSGHTALSEATYGALALIFYAGRGRRNILIALLLGFLPVVIAYSRVVLHFHTAPEAVTGFIVGLLCLFICARVVGFSLRNQVQEALSGWQIIKLALITGIAMIVTYGSHIPAEAKVGSVAMWVRHHIAYCRR